MKKKIQLLELLRCIFVAITFLAVDFSLRFFTRWLGYYSIFELAPALFSLCWTLLFIVVLSLFPRKTGRIVYAVLYAVWAIYAVAQYIYYLIFDKFFFISDMSNAGEGVAYLDFVEDALNCNVAVMVAVYLVFGVIGFLLFPDFKRISNTTRRFVVRIYTIALICIGMAVIPLLYTSNDEAMLFYTSKYEYAHFNNSAFDMEIAGLYHYVARDCWLSYLKPAEDSEELVVQVDAYFSEKYPSGGVIIRRICLQERM